MLHTNRSVKFPQERPPFPPVCLCDNDRGALIELADILVAETLVDYDSHLNDQRGLVDTKRWQKVHRFEDVTLYQDQQTIRERRLSRGDIMLDNKELPKAMQKLLWFGTVHGDLDDIMYGSVSPTAEGAKIKAAYVGSNILDVSVLATLVSPTREDPFQGLQLKWMLNGAPALMRSVVRRRDFVCLEATGMATNSTGERVGYHILHSIAFQAVPELHRQNIVRGNMTLYHLYRQKSDNIVETYVKGFIDVMGDMPASMATRLSAKSLVSVWKLVEYAHMKKLNWMLSKRKPFNVCFPTGYCSVCDSNLRGAMVRRRTCKICTSWVCVRCSTYKKMFYVAPQARSVVHKRVAVCANCDQIASCENGLDVAQEELAGKHGHERAYAHWGAVSPASSVASAMF